MIQAICWTLIHSLWQGLLFAMATGLVMLLTRQARAAVRYNILCLLFFLFLFVCAGTFVYEWSRSGRVIAGEGVAAGVVAGGWAGQWIAALGRYCSDHALPIVWAWLFVFSMKSLRMLGSLLYVQRIRHYGISAPPAGWQKKVDELSQQLGIGRAVQLVESKIVKVPLVTGYWRPMIFMPLGLLTGLPQGEIEAVLLHELAHIHRNDWLVNLLQQIAGNLLFFNPGFLWMSTLLRDEREHCCDDIAIDRTQDRVQLVRALINFKEYDLRMTRLANAFPARKDQLLQRVTRIVHHTNKTLDTSEKIFLLVSSVLIAMLVITTGAPSQGGRAQIGRLPPNGSYRIIVDTPVVKERKEMMIKEVQVPVVRPLRRVTKMIPETVEPAAGGETQRQLMEMDAASRKVAFDQKETAAIQVMRDKEQAERDMQQAMLDRRQAGQDKVQAERDHEQAIRDKQQAERDALQAIRDKQQAERDAHQAMPDRVQARKDAVRAVPPIVNLKM